MYPIDLKIIFGISLLQPGPPKSVFLATPLDMMTMDWMLKPASTNKGISIALVNRLWIGYGAGSS